MPVVPLMPTSPVAGRKAHRDSTASAKSKPDSDAAPKPDQDQEEAQAVADPAPVVPAPPKSWADLVRKQSASNGPANTTAAAAPVVNGLFVPTSESLGDVLGEINVAEAPSKLVFLQPRGLVNTGNMCYMNSVSGTGMCDDHPC